jgi:hypothetical protein
MSAAPQGSLVRIGGTDTTASITGGNAPFDIAQAGVLALTVNGTDQQVDVPQGALTVDALNALTSPIGVTAGTNAQNQLVLSTVQSGANAQIRVRSDAQGSVHEALGLAANASANGASGQAQVFRKSGQNWLAADDAPLDLSNQQPGDAPRIGDGPAGGQFVTMRI